MQYPWRIRLLGGLVLERAGETPITRFRSQKAAALLAYLAHFSQRAHTREELLALFWPDADEEDARRSLRVTLSSLRHQLEPAGTLSGSVLEATRTHVRLNPQAFATDVADLEVAVARKDYEVARQFVIGPFLPACYDDWALSERYRLEEMMANLPPATTEILISEATLSPSISRPFSRSTAKSPQRLPRLLTRFFGRQTERERVTQLLIDPNVRLVTLLGLGGNGKTRLAIEIAWNLLEGNKTPASYFEGGIFFVPLADCRDATQIIGRIKNTLSLSQAINLSDFLLGKRCLLILDNLEQIAQGALSPLTQLLMEVPEITLLITSRQRLGISGEQLVRVPSLPLPSQESDEAENLLSLLESPAVCLFVNRMQSQVPDFTLTRHNARAIVSLCQQLGGAPLALELAAAWGNVLTPQQMVERLKNKFEWLHARSEREREERHRSLEATIAWSIDLLSPELQRCFTDLCVFAGGFTEAAADTIARASLEDLGRLRDRSLLQQDILGQEVRWRIPVVLREFTNEKVTQDKRHDHLNYFVALSQEAYCSPPAQVRHAWARLEADIDNLHAALHYAHSHSPLLALSLAANLQPFWETHGSVSEGILHLEKGLQNTEINNSDILLQARALTGLGLLYLRQKQYEKAISHVQQALAFSEEQNDIDRIAFNLHNLGIIWSNQGNQEKAEWYLTQAMEKKRGRGLETQAITMISLGNMRLRQERYSEAEPLLLDACQILKEAGDERNLLYTWNALGILKEQTEGMESALICYQESLKLCRRLGDLRNGYSAINNCAEICFEQQDYLQTTRLYGLCDALVERIGLIRSPGTQLHYDTNIKLLSKTLGADFNQCYRQGKNDDWLVYP